MKVRENKGFLLVEVLVAISILAFGLVYISRALTNCLNVMEQISYYTRSLNLAEEKFFDYQTQGNPLKDESGNFPDESNFKYALETSGLGDLDLKEIDIQVSWKEGRRAGNFQIAGYLPIKNE